MTLILHFYHVQMSFTFNRQFSYGERCCKTCNGRNLKRN
ncbi:unnamed protein product [Paramecium primaurelia]|uniref:Uncharacterized protein n=1 Tax=Paramecium primaurelia TaxID=5886 RepID=A0A8S1L0R7_PARPR|nr:unnamed protein product [Paramecium primaurelia]